MCSRDKRRNLPLHVAADAGHVELVKILSGFPKTLDQDEKRSREGKNAMMSRIQERGHKRITPLHLATLWGSLAASQFLVENGADVNSRCLSGTPLHCAAENGKKQITQLVLSTGAETRADGLVAWTPLHVAAIAGQNKAMKVLLDHDYGPDAVNRPDIKGGMPWISQSLVHTKMSSRHLDGTRNSPSTRVLTGYRRRKASFIWSNGFNSHLADTTAQFGPPFIWLQPVITPKILSWILTSSDDIVAGTLQRDELLHSAIAMGFEHALWFLDRIGFDLERPNRDGYTPLQCAARAGHATLVQCLLEAGVRNDGNATRRDKTALVLASTNGHATCMRILLEKGADLDPYILHYSGNQQARRIQAWSCISSRETSMSIWTSYKSF